MSAFLWGILSFLSLSSWLSSSLTASTVAVSSASEKTRLEHAVFKEVTYLFYKYHHCHVKRLWMTSYMLSRILPMVNFVAICTWCSVAKYLANQSLIKNGWNLTTRLLLRISLNLHYSSSSTPVSMKVFLQSFYLLWYWKYLKSIHSWCRFLNLFFAFIMIFLPYLTWDYCQHKVAPKTTDD